MRMFDLDPDDNAWKNFDIIVRDPVSPDKAFRHEMRNALNKITAPIGVLSHQNSIDDQEADEFLGNLEDFRDDNTNVQELEKEAESVLEKVDPDNKFYKNISDSFEKLERLSSLVDAYEDAVYHRRVDENQSFERLFQEVLDDKEILVESDDLKQKNYPVVLGLITDTLYDNHQTHAAEYDFELKVSKHNDSLRLEYESGPEGESIYPPKSKGKGLRIVGSIVDALEGDFSIEGGSSSEKNYTVSVEIPYDLISE